MNPVYLSLRQRLTDIGNKLHVKTHDDWYAITREAIRDLGGHNILRSFNMNLHTTLQNLFPEFTWNPLLIRSVSHKHWKDKTAQRLLLDEIGNKLGVVFQEDWYSVTVRQVCNNGGSCVLTQYYNNCLFSCLQSIYPEYQWNKLNFSTCTHQNQSERTKLYHKQVMDAMAAELGIETQQDWYKVGSSKAINRSFLHEHYNGSLFTALTSIYPQYEWNPLLFPVVPRNFWKEQSNHRTLMDSIADRLGIQTQEDWYDVTAEMANQVGGIESLLNQHYNASLSVALSRVYPEYEWNSQQFKFVPRNYWNQISNQRLFFDRLAEKFEIVRQEDWYQITATDVNNCGGSGLIGTHYGGSLFAALQKVYSEYEWNIFKFSATPHGIIRNLPPDIIVKNLVDVLGDSVSSSYWMSRITFASRFLMENRNSLRVITQDTSWLQTLRHLLYESIKLKRLEGSTALLE